MGYNPMEVRDSSRVVYYFDRFVDGQVDFIEPAFVIKPSYAGRQMAVKQLGSDEGLNEEVYDPFESLEGASYYAVERYHRAVASTLASNELRVLELENNTDLLWARTFDDFGHKERTPRKLVATFELYVVGCCDGTISSMWEAANDFVERDNIPERVKERWKEVKGEGYGLD